MDVSWKETHSIWVWFYQCMQKASHCLWHYDMSLLWQCYVTLMMEEKNVLCIVGKGSLVRISLLVYTCCLRNKMFLWFVICPFKYWDVLLLALPCSVAYVLPSTVIKTVTIPKHSFAIFPLQWTQRRLFLGRDKYRKTYSTVRFWLRYFSVIYILYVRGRGKYIMVWHHLASLFLKSQWTLLSGSLRFIRQTLPLARLWSCLFFF